MLSIKSMFLLGGITLLVSCTSGPLTINLTNTLDVSRQNETVEINIYDLPQNMVSMIERVGVYDPSEGLFLTTQLIDLDKDGQMDQLIFQPELVAKSSKIYHIIEHLENETDVKYCYSRFVPSRIDDYTWENNRVAFRTYGPAAQDLIENGQKGGIISSGIDCWLKRVDYPVIDKWYKASEEEGISYHEDHGEGLDNYHVGISRGAGGLSIKGADDQYFVSKNFTAYNTISNGPLRTIFQLDYADWDGPDGKIKEQKTISLDYGNNLMKIEVSIEGTDKISAGISLQQSMGIIHESNNFLTYKQNHFDTTLSNVIMTTLKHYDGYHIYNPGIKDQNHVFLDFKILNETLTYYVGFYWSKSNQFSGHEAWDQYLNDLAMKIENPITVNIK